MQYNQRVKPKAAALKGRDDLQKYAGQIGRVLSVNEGEHVMVFWQRLGVSSVWAIKDLRAAS